MKYITNNNRRNKNKNINKLQVVSSATIDLLNIEKETRDDPMMQAVCQAAKTTHDQQMSASMTEAESRDLSEEKQIPSTIAAAIRNAKQNTKIGELRSQQGKSVFNIGMAIQAGTFLMIMIRSEVALAKMDMCWARLLRSTKDVTEDTIRRVNICLSVSKRLWKSGECHLPTADVGTVEAVFCTLYALLKADPKFLANVYGEMVEGIPRKYMGMLREREREFQEITDNFMFIFGDVEKNQRPPIICISKDEQYITLSIGSPVIF